MASDTAPPRTAGIVLAGTHPWANSRFEQVLPRPLLPIAHRPLITYALSWLHDAVIQDVVVCGNRESHAVHAWLAGHEPEGLRPSYQQDPMPRGAGGSLLDAASISDAEVFVVADGTSIPNVSLNDLLLAHATAGAAATVVVHSEPRRHGNASMQVPSGIYVFCRSALEAAGPRGFCDIKEHLIPRLYRSGERVISYAAPAAPLRVLDASTYMSANQRMVERLLSDAPPPGFMRRGHSLVHEEAVVATDASLVGSVLVCPGARVMSGAVIVGPASVGRDVTIGRRALISRSAVWRRSVVGEGAFADRCILTDDSVIEPRTGLVGEVVVTNGDGLATPVRSAPQHGDLVNRPSTDLLRRFGRLFAGTGWSRSPAG
jgi:mannose-1-phosphate guanylyltransferase/phosphomannomutase